MKGEEEVSVENNMHVCTAIGPTRGAAPMIY